MMVIDILRQATMDGVSTALSHHLGIGPRGIKHQLLKAIDILSLQPVHEVHGYVVIHQETEPLDIDDTYYAVSHVHDCVSLCPALVPWGEWLYMPVHVMGEALTIDEMAAHILYEMTSAGAPICCN